MLLELHHWSYPVLNETDIDDLLAYLVYYPEWKKRISKPGGTPIRRAYADQVDF